jgi:hypothetical protein
VTEQIQEAYEVVAGGTPTVLVGADGAALGTALAGAPDGQGRERLLGVMVGDPESAGTLAAAEEMARELWPWAKSVSGRTPARETGTGPEEAPLG